MPGARCTRSLVCAMGSEYAHEYSQRATGKHPTFPHAMVYGLFRALPGDRLSCHRHLADMWLVRARLGRLASARLDAGVEASGPHVFTVRVSAVRQHAADRSQAKARPAITCHA
jgi:hypothetical protein